MWAAGVALGSAVVAWWRVVGAGYVWLSGAVVLLFGAPAVWAGGGWVATAGCVPAAAAIVLGRRSAAVAAFAAAGAAFLGAAVPDGGVVPSITGAALLGGVTVEMMLGHWFLVDPRLPRRVLRLLCLGAAAGALADPVVLAMAGAVPWDPGDLAAGIGYLVLAVATMVLLAAVWASLGEDGYPAVMAATGLSYLAVLTAIGSSVLGRLLAGGSVLG